MSVAAGDWDKDGLVEVAAGSLRGSDHVRLYYGLSQFVLTSFFAFDIGGGVGVAVFDADADGVADLVAASRVGPRVRAFGHDARIPLRDYSALEPTYRGGIGIG